MFRVRMDDNTVRRLKQAADALDTTMSDVVRKGIDLVYDGLKLYTIH